MYQTTQLIQRQLQVSRIVIIGLSYHIIEVQKNGININLKQTT